MKSQLIKLLKCNSVGNSSNKNNLSKNVKDKMQTKWKRHTQRQPQKWLWLARVIEAVSRSDDEASAVTWKIIRQQMEQQPKPTHLHKVCDKM